MVTDLVIPVWNERDSLAMVFPEIPRQLVRRVIVVDGGSSDGTQDVARALGATVVQQTARGYGRACFEGFLATEGADAVAFLDGDYSDPPARLPELLAPLAAGDADLVVGSRTRGPQEAGGLMAQQVWGNRLAVLMIRRLYGCRLSDLGSFKAIRRPVLAGLAMQEMTYGWTTEMIVKSAKAGHRVVEVPVGVRRRWGGRSKVAGSWRAGLQAGFQILRTVTRYA